mmetsp:Transcript_8422/g.35211  ORF Transcript_8422/g.35211 Transcript_8422/m.35211 type:complete len:369 (-) Transcript_8422:708-1814(-)
MQAPPAGGGGGPGGCRRGPCSRRRGGEGGDRRREAGADGGGLRQREHSVPPAAAARGAHLLHAGALLCIRLCAECGRGGPEALAVPGGDLQCVRVRHHQGRAARGDQGEQCRCGVPHIRAQRNRALQDGRRRGARVQGSAAGRLRTGARLRPVRHDADALRRKAAQEARGELLHARRRHSHILLLARCVPAPAALFSRADSWQRQPPLWQRVPASSWQSRRSTSESSATGSGRSPCTASGSRQSGSSHCSEYSGLYLPPTRSLCCWSAMPYQPASTMNTHTSRSSGNVAASTRASTMEVGGASAPERVPNTFPSKPCVIAKRQCSMACTMSPAMCSAVKTLPLSDMRRVSGGLSFISSSYMGVSVSGG